jgi:hypothetical protein
VPPHLFQAPPLLHPRSSSPSNGFILLTRQTKHPQFPCSPLKRELVTWPRSVRAVFTHTCPIGHVPGPCNCSCSPPCSASLPFVRSRKLCQEWRSDIPLKSERERKREGEYIYTQGSYAPYAQRPPHSSLLPSSSSSLRSLRTQFFTHPYMPLRSLTDTRTLQGHEQWYCALANVSRLCTDKRLCSATTVCHRVSVLAVGVWALRRMSIPRLASRSPAMKAP